jgi:hypothetical protein
MPFKWVIRIQEQGFFYSDPHFELFTIALVRTELPYICVLLPTGTIRKDFFQIEKKNKGEEEEEIKL